jgi:uncharacterized protein YqeY
MGDLSDRIERDYIEAYKAKNDEKVAVLRMLKAALKNKQVELGREPDDQETLRIISSQVKQRNDSVQQFSAAGREDLSKKEAREIEILNEYLPPPLSEEELGRMVDEAVSETGAEGMKDMGRVMQAVMPKVQGRVDGKKVSDMVRSRLST